MGQVFTSDVLIIGAGLAGERVAVAAAQQGLNVTKEKLKHIWI